MSPLEELLESLQGLAKRLGHPEFKGELAELASMASARIATLEAQIAEAKEPVAWYDPEYGLPYGLTEEPPTANAVYLYAAPVPSDRDGWQPIETAPKDGTRILLFFNKRYCRGMRNDEVILGFWHQPGNPAHKGFWTGWGSGRATATHWMPLPAPPAMEEGK